MVWNPGCLLKSFILYSIHILVYNFDFSFLKFSKFSIVSYKSYLTRFDSCLSNLYESHLRKLFGEVGISVMNQHKERIKFQFQFPSWFDLVFDSNLKTTRTSWVPMFINQRSVQYDNSYHLDFLRSFFNIK